MTSPVTATVTITLLDQPSRSKQAGPCWARIGDGSHAGATYATSLGAEVVAEVGDELMLEACARLRRTTRVDRDDAAIRVRVTGDPTDVVEISVGSPQSVDARVTGVVER